jgi:hypothetical protein
MLHMNFKIQSVVENALKDRKYFSKTLKLLSELKTVDILTVKLSYLYQGTK